MLSEGKFRSGTVRFKAKILEIEIRASSPQPFQGHGNGDFVERHGLPQRSQRLEKRLRQTDLVARMEHVFHWFPIIRGIRHRLHDSVIQNPHPGNLLLAPGDTLETTGGKDSECISRTDLPVAERMADAYRVFKEEFVADDNETDLQTAERSFKLLERLFLSDLPLQLGAESIELQPNPCPWPSPARGLIVTWAGPPRFSTSKSLRRFENPAMFAKPGRSRKCLEILCRTTLGPGAI